MSAFKRSEQWVAKFQLGGEQRWVPGGPWPTKKAALKAEHAHRAKLEARRESETCASFAERWLIEWPRTAASSQANYRSAAQRFAARFGEAPLAGVDRLDARSWALTVPRNVSRVVATMFEDARDVGLVSANPFHRLRLPVERADEINPPTLDEYRHLIAAADALGPYGQEVRAMLQFSAWTGVRASELYGLQWPDVGEQTIWIHRARKRDGSLTKPKNGEEREIAFVPPARVLDELPRRPDPFVFHSPRGRPLRDHSHKTAWRRLREAAALPHVRWHDLRHFCATQLLELGMSHFDVAVQLGHRDGGQLVMQRYGHPSEDAARARLLRAFEFDATETGSSAGSREAV